MGVGQGTVEDLVSAPLREVLGRTFAGRRVLVTGHNGFVGTWCSLLLAAAGADVVGCSLARRDGELADLCGLDRLVESHVVDVRDGAALRQLLSGVRPEIVLHLAAQALVIPSVEDPVTTFATNVLGTANLLEALRELPETRAAVIVTSDKCYATSTTPQREGDPLGGDDPYSASKAAQELVAHAFRASVLDPTHLGVATARAGNVVGGGDFSPLRVVPDVVRAISADAPIRLRDPGAIRPWQHVLDAVAGYLRLADALVAEPEGASEAWNFGPDQDVPHSVGEVVAIFCDRWAYLSGTEVPTVRHDGAGRVPERHVLTLDSAKARARLGWRPVLEVRDAIAWSADWYHAATDARSARAVTRAQIARFLELEAAATRRPLALAGR